MKVATKVGMIDTPELEGVGPRTKYWAEALSDLARIEEIYCVLGAALEEAYRAGAAHAVVALTQQNLREIVDAEFEVIEEGSGGPKSAAEASREKLDAATEGSEPAESDVPGDGSGPAEPPAETADVPGCDTESGERQLGN